MQEDQYDKQGEEQSQQPQQSQQSGSASQSQPSSSDSQPQAIGTEADDDMVEEALKNGQPSNTISEWQRVHDKKYVEDITEKTEKH